MDASQFIYFSGRPIIAMVAHDERVNLKAVQEVHDDAASSTGDRDIFFLTTCFLAPAEAMESEYRPYEPVVRVHPPPRYVPMGRTTPQVVPPEAMRNAAGPVYRTGDGSHPPFAPHVQADHRPGEIQKPHTGGAGLPIWQW